MVYSVSEVAKLLGISKLTIKKILSVSDIGFKLRSGGRWFFDDADLLRIMNEMGYLRKKMYFYRLVSSPTRILEGTYPVDLGKEALIDQVLAGKKITAYNKLDQVLLEKGVICNPLVGGTPLTSQTQRSQGQNRTGFMKKPKKKSTRHSIAVVKPPTG